MLLYAMKPVNNTVNTAKQNLKERRQIRQKRSNGDLAKQIGDTDLTRSADTLRLLKLKANAISELDVKLYKAFHRKYDDIAILMTNINDIYDTLEEIYDINKQNNVYRLFDDDLI